MSRNVQILPLWLDDRCRSPPTANKNPLNWTQVCLNKMKLLLLFFLDHFHPFHIQVFTPPPHLPHPTSSSSFKIGQFISKCRVAQLLKRKWLVTTTTTTLLSHRSPGRIRKPWMGQRIEEVKDKGRRKRDQVSYPEKVRRTSEEWKQISFRPRPTTSPFYEPGNTTDRKKKLIRHLYSAKDFCNKSSSDSRSKVHRRSAAEGAVKHKS